MATADDHAVSMNNHATGCRLVRQKPRTLIALRDSGEVDRGPGPVQRHVLAGITEEADIGLHLEPASLLQDGLIARTGGTVAIVIAQTAGLTGPQHSVQHTRHAQTYPDMFLSS